MWQAEGGMMSRGTEWAVTASSLDFLGATQNGVVSQSHLSFPKMRARGANPCLSRTGNQTEPSPRARLAKQCRSGREESSLLLKGWWQQYFFAGELGVPTSGRVLEAWAGPF